MTQNCTIYETSYPRKIWWKACGCQIDEHPQGMCNKQSGPIDILAIAQENLRAARPKVYRGMIMNGSPDAERFLDSTRVDCAIAEADYSAAYGLMMDLRA